MRKIPITQVADPETHAAVERLVRLIVHDQAILGVYAKLIGEVPCVVVVGVGSHISSMLVTCVDALQGYIRQEDAKAMKEEVRH